MPDYKEMYLTLFRATTQAIDLLIAAQQTCEELYLERPSLEVLSWKGSESKTEPKD